MSKEKRMMKTKAFRMPWSIDPEDGHTIRCADGNIVGWLAGSRCHEPPSGDHYDHHTDANGDVIVALTTLAAALKHTSEE